MALDNPFSPVFNPPGSVTRFAEVIDFHIKHNASWIYALLAPVQEDEPIVALSWLEFGRAIHRAAHFINPIIDGLSSIGTGNVVGIFAVTDTLLYQTLMLGIIRSGNIPFPISHRNTTTAIVDLLEKTSCHHVVFGTDTTSSHTSDQVQSDLNARSYRITVITFPTTHILFPQLGHESDTPFELYPAINMPNAGEPVIIQHSSGSTGLPKPIFLTDSFLLNELHLSRLNLQREGTILGALALPPFHAMGIYCQVTIPFSSGVTATFWTPSTPPPTPSPVSTLAAFKRTNCTVVISVPSFLVVWGRNESAMSYLSSVSSVAYGGGPLTPEVGDRLVRKGVPVHPIYGATELGMMNDLLPEPYKDPKEWAWLDFKDEIKIRWIPQSDDPLGAHELVVLKSERYHPAVYNTQDRNEPSYSTNDLFIPHPNKPCLWKIIGRLDDQVILATGEKINPRPIQDVVLQNPLITGAAVIGRAKNQVGLIVEPANGHEINPGDFDDLAKFRNEIWPSIEAANRVSAAFARIFKEAVLVTSPQKPLIRTPKGTVALKASIKLYEQEIEELYDTLEKAKSADSPPPPSWCEEDVTSWLIKIAEELLGRPVDSKKDLFEQGGDSLSATFLRNRIIGARRRTKASSKQQALLTVDQNIVYMYPTIVSLAKRIAEITSTPQLIHDSRIGDRNNLLSLVDRYTASIPTTPRVPREIVLLTGSTGALGSFLLGQLLADERVERVWAINRTVRDKTVEQRQRTSFIDKGIDVSLLNRNVGKVVFVEAELSQEQLGLNSRLYREIQSSTTLIIHNAWRLDFNLSVSSFESHIQGTRNLVDMACSSPLSPHVRMVFTSSVSAVGSWHGTTVAVPEEPISDPSVSSATGYGESKFIAEKILEEARTRAGLQTANFRIGHLCGAENGFWAVSDWVPIIVASSVHLGCLPDAVGTVSWVPLGQAAKAIIDVAFNRETPLNQTYHIFHPRPVLRTTIFRAISTAMAPITNGNPLPLVPFSEWLARLKSSDSDDITRLPALKLLSFMRGLSIGDIALRASGVDVTKREAFQMVTLSTEKIRDASPTMRDLTPLGDDAVKSWVDYWLRKGLLKSSRSVL